MEPSVARHCLAADTAPYAPGFEMLARSITHELRQPLSLICGYSELLANGSLTDAERSTLVDEIRRAARRLAASIDLVERSDNLRVRTFGSASDYRVLDLRSRLDRDAVTTA